MTSKTRIKSTTGNAPNKKGDTEPYHCKGKFLDDFEALCRQAQITFIVPVVQRPRPPGTPINPVDPKEKAKTAKTKEKDVHEVEEPPNDESLPKTYSLKDNYEYFKPKIQVEMDNPDKQETITEIHIRAWKIDRATLEIFQQSFPTLERLNTLNFWHTGFTDETLAQLASLLPKCPNLKNLILDSNPLTNERYDVLLTDDTISIVNLSLRHCRITERGAAHISNGLGNERRQNSKLQTLNLGYNEIGDAGAEQIAKGLKFNRTLLVLNLSSNDISDNGSEKLAAVLSKFPLSREELLYRRQLLLHSAISESVPTLSARKINDGVRRNSLTSPTTQRKKSAAAVTLPTKKGKSDDKYIIGDGMPLLDQNAELMNNDLVLPGNRCLLSLNLSKNRISETGVNHFLKAIQYQEMFIKLNISRSTTSPLQGLLRLELQRNDFQLDNDYYVKLQILLKNRLEPIFKGKETEIELNGRETVGSVKARG
ncbi:unnamed protein product [Didymodactylos carnosus]|uniref:Leucine-rich repeat-containing protein 71 n=1 Tax=Didymodactylos carnosus TaxID=1234261 RepID=A0A814SN67_9BILA|nr:unnamed protein product [Didymodactylos carnosus]CAF1149588.1 unnamed protein product [Didymodactylos carnosus]CAF3825491.1 unnamed protein product [Didymodactylos carnosus]CAF3913115.1 unnamed protein product [Didymodactylos carnosus]